MNELSYGHSAEPPAGEGKSYTGPQDGEAKSCPPLVGAQLEFSKHIGDGNVVKMFIAVPSSSPADLLRVVKSLEAFFEAEHVPNGHSER
jgi:hypothetical protein